jgi:ribonuclease T1
MNSVLLRLKRPLLAGILAFLWALAWVVFSASVTSPSAWARKAVAEEVTDATSTIALTNLPAQGREMYSLIGQGGPFKYDKDGVVFGNRERQLPAQKRGYYREYTVKTPYARDRGARRIVCGGEPKTPDACYYTDDHYASFKKIVP